MRALAYRPLEDPACADPEHLALVDEAFTSPGGDAGHQMRETLCRHCPAARDCLREAMQHPESGVWGGTSPTLRTRHGGPSIIARTQ